MSDGPNPPEHIRQADELAALRRMLDLSLGTFSLSVAVCNAPDLSRRLIEALVEAQPGISVLKVTDKTENILTWTLKSIKDQSPTAVFLMGLDVLIPSGAPNYPVLRTLNASREQWSRRLACPVVFWLPEYAAGILSVKAPDFWRWKSHQFHFAKASYASLAQAAPLFAMNVNFAVDLPKDQKLFRIAELKQRLKEAGTPPPKKHRLAVASWLGELAVLHTVLGEPHKNVEYHEKALVVLRELSDRRGEGAVLGNLGITYGDLGEPLKAIGFYEQGLEIAREIGNRQGEGNGLVNLGNAYSLLGESLKAIGLYKQGLEIAREIGDRRVEGAVLGNLGITYGDLGEPLKAIGFYEQGLEIAREIGNRQGEGTILGNLGNAYGDLGEPLKAIGLYEQGLEIALEIGYSRGEGNALWNMAQAYEKLSDPARAVPLARSALTIYEQIEDPFATQVRDWLAKQGKPTS